MIKKIQQYLLLNHPLLWNTKIVPVLLSTIILNILSFIIGYLFTNINFKESYHTNTGSFILYSGIVLLIILLFIVWLVYYSKNNAFKAFYPKKTSSLYSEWLLIFIIIFCLSLFPFSLYKGQIYKTRSYVSKTELLKDLETLNMIDILIPTYKTNYFEEYPTEIHQQNVQMSNKGNTQTYIDQAYVDSITNQNIYYEDYPNFAQLSLLNYSDTYGGIYIPKEYKSNIRGSETVKKWLVNEDEQKISELMDSYLKLQEKHQLKTNLTKEKWMQLIYNPAKYPVGDFNLISRYSYDNYSNYYDNYSANNYYLSYNDLTSAYTKILKAYSDNDTSETFILTIIYFALGISLLVFSFRATSGKAWLIALISLGLIFFVNGIVTFLVDSSTNNFDIARQSGLIFYMSVLLLIFLFEMLSVVTKNKGQTSKGRSDIYMNHLIWFIPAVPMLIFFIIYIIGKNSYDIDSYDIDYNHVSSSHSTYEYMKDNIIGFLWGNICLTFISMWLFIRFILREWKSLPEE